MKSLKSLELSKPSEVKVANDSPCYDFIVGVTQCLSGSFNSLLIRSNLIKHNDHGLIISKSNRLQWLTISRQLPKFKILAPNPG